MSRTCSTKIPGKQDAHKKTATTSCNACHWFICYNQKCKYVHTKPQERSANAYFVALNALKKYSKRKKQKTLSIKEIDAVWKGIKPLSFLGNICPWFNNFQTDLQALSTSGDTLETFSTIIHSFIQNISDFNKNVRYSGGKVLDKKQNVILDFEKKLHGKTTEEVFDKHGIPKEANIGADPAKTSSTGYSLKVFDKHGIPKEANKTTYVYSKEANIGADPAKISSKLLDEHDMDGIPMEATKEEEHYEYSSNATNDNWSEEGSNAGQSLSMEREEANHSVDQSVSTESVESALFHGSKSPPPGFGWTKEATNIPSQQKEEEANHYEYSSNATNDNWSEEGSSIDQSVSTESERALFHGSSKSPPGFGWGNGGIIPMFSTYSESLRGDTAPCHNYWNKVNEVPQKSTLQKQNDALISINTQLQMEITRLKQEAEAFKQLWLDLKFQTDNMTFT